MVGDDGQSNNLAVLSDPDAVALIPIAFNVQIMVALLHPHVRPHVDIPLKRFNLRFQLSDARRLLGAVLAQMRESVAVKPALNPGACT